MWEQFEASLASGNLVRLVEEMKSEGLSQLEICDRFERFRAMLREANREEDEDAVLGVMDRIVGWCGPEARLFAHPLSNEEIEACRRGAKR